MTDSSDVRGEVGRDNASDRPDPQSLVQFVHPEKLLAALPGASGLTGSGVAQLYGLCQEDFDFLRSTFRDAVSIAARGALAVPRVHAALAGLPFRCGDVVVTVGDSITDDYQSWSYIFQEILSLAGAPSISVVNAGVSGDTTADVLARLQAVATAQPTWLIFMVGTNDVCTYGPVPSKPIVSADESRANLASIAAFAEHLVGANVVWLTPPPVMPDRVCVAPALLERKIGVSLSEINTRAELVRSLCGTVVDIHAAFEADPDPTLFLDDGVHPSLAGQRKIAEEFIYALGSRDTGARRGD